MQYKTLILAAAMAGLSTSALGQTLPPATQRYEVDVYQTPKVTATDERIGQLKAPAGFHVQKFAEDLKGARIIVVAGDGAIYVTRREPGDCLLLRDTDNDGKADEQIPVAHIPGLHGLAISPDGSKAYMVTVNELYVADRASDGMFGVPKKLIKDLPDAGQHPNRTISFGPDGMLYLSVGSTTNAANEPNPESATILKISPDATSRTIFARGLRNTIGFSWHPQTHEFWGMDHGIDFLGSDNTPEELNKIEEGKHYGWPIVFGQGQINIQPAPPNELSRDEFKKMTTPATLLYTSHAAPMQMAFYTGTQFPEEYRNDAFVTMRGSWNRFPPAGYEVVRIHFENGQPAAIEPFITGFLVSENDGQYGQFARLVGCAVTHDGALLVGDQEQGIIYRVSYKHD